MRNSRSWVKAILSYPIHFYLAVSRSSPTPIRYKLTLLFNLRRSWLG